MFWSKKDEDIITIVDNYRVDRNGRYIDINTADDLPDELPLSITFGECTRWLVLLYRDLKKEHNRIKNT
jgi:hypothetical protein